MKRSLFIFLLTLNISGVFAQGIDKPQYQIVTHRAGTYLGTFNIELFPLIAPLHTHNFDSLVSEQFYDSTASHFDLGTGTALAADRSCRVQCRQACAGDTWCGKGQRSEQRQLAILYLRCQRDFP
jgi:hypothetical protein